MDQMTKAWNRFSGYAKFKKSVKGYFRAMEVTRNRKYTSENYGTYHPQFHVLMAVPNDYFGRNYIKQADWAAMWKKAMKLDYMPIVNVERVKAKKDSTNIVEIDEEIQEAIAEQKRKQSLKFQNIQ